MVTTYHTVINRGARVSALKVGLAHVVTTDDVDGQTVMLCRFTHKQAIRARQIVDHFGLGHYSGPPTHVSCAPMVAILAVYDMWDLMPLSA